MTQEPKLLESTASDGVNVQAVDEGSGPIILILHPGMDDGTSWRKVSALLADRYRVLTVRRRQYRFDLGARGPASIADEVLDVAAIVAAANERVLLVGHSSGGVVALESLLALPAAFAGAVIYEAPVVTELPLGRIGSIEAMRSASAAGKQGKAMEIFTRDIVSIAPWQARLIRIMVGVMPRFRRLVPRQVDDTLAIRDLGDRRIRYRSITVPVLLLGGDKSPDHLGARLDSLAAVIPNTSRTTMRGQGHGANASAPAEVAGLIGAFAKAVL